MMDDRNSSERIFKDLVGVSSRYEKNPAMDKGHNLLVCVSFHEAVFGKKSDDKVSFKLKIFAAELMVMVNDPLLQIDLKSILKSNPSDNREIEETSGQSSQKSFNAGGKLRINPELSAKAGSTENLGTRQTERYKAGPIDYRYHPIDDKQHLWVLAPYPNKKHLQGNVWNGDKELLTVIDNRNDPDTISPSIKIIIECKREDLDIIDLEYLKPWSLHIKEKEYIAMEMIKDALIEYKLVESGLSVKEISHRYFPIKLADILVEIE